jgi:hypothetical protein
MNRDAAITAPVLPAETNAFARPDACSANPLWMDDSGFRFTATAGGSSIPMTCGA